jgi:hypothetical protein
MAVIAILHRSRGASLLEQTAGIPGADHICDAEIPASIAMLRRVPGVPDGSKLAAFQGHKR